MSGLHAFTVAPRAFTVDFPQSDIDELNRRLEAARWPDSDVYPDDLSAAERLANFGLGKGDHPTSVSNQ